MQQFLQNSALALTLITGTITLVSLIIKGVVKLYNTRYRFKPVPNHKIVDLFISAYFLLRTEQIYSTGLWGKTITKYVYLNFPRDPYIKKRTTQYKLNGSITHTAHAFKGLTTAWNYADYKPNIILKHLHNQIENSRKESGLFHPDINAIVNTEEFDNLAHELRHNSTTLSTICFLKQHSTNCEMIEKYNLWIKESLMFIFSLPKEKLWLCDANYGHSLAYMLQSFDLLVRDSDTQLEHKLELNELIKSGINSLMWRKENNYWLLKSHPKTKCFYTLLILEILLRIDLFYQDRENLNIAYNVIENLLNCRNKDNGLSLGATKDNSIYSLSDVGVTARLAVVIDILINHVETTVEFKTKTNNLRKALNESLGYIQNNYLAFYTSAYNNITHSYESILQTIHLFDKNIDKNELQLGLINSDNISNEILRDQLEPKTKSILKGFYYNRFIYKIIIRDFKHNPSKILSKFSNRYWG